MKSVPEELRLDGRAVECPICGYDRFMHQRVLLNTRAATFFNFEWLNRGADVHECASCGHLLWFVKR
ncbi:MAG: hypothetical protein AAF823_14040 [Planctomycetota bacterium]